MYELLTPLAEAECRHCGGKITQYRGDLSLGARWSHEVTGTAYCPGAPTAWPVDETIRDLTIAPVTSPGLPPAADPTQADVGTEGER